MKQTKTIYRTLTRTTFSLGSVLLILGLLLGMFPQPVSAVVNWDKSSLSFSGGCSGNCQEVKATVCNGKDSRDMQGPTAYQVYYVPSGNPKNGSVVASGSIPALKSGECVQLTYNPNNVSGVYMFRAEQRPGHPGTGELWSDECSVGSCQIPTTPPPPTATPTQPPTEPPTITPTPFNNLRLTFMCGYVGDNEYIWRVRNSNPFAVDFTWDVYGSSENGSGTVPASSEVFFTTSTGDKTVRLFVDGQQNDVKASGNPCKVDLSLSYFCTDGGQRWVVSNPNNFAQDYTWQSSSGHSGGGNAPANGSDDFFVASLNGMTVTITYSHDPFGARSVSSTSQMCEQPTETPTEEPTITPSGTPVVTETVTPPPTITPTDEPTSTPTEEPTITPSSTPTVIETPSVTPSKTSTPPTKTFTPPVKSPTPVSSGTPETPSTPVVTESPKTPVVTETAIGTAVSTSTTGQPQSTPAAPATLAPPAGSNSGVLIPVTGGDLSSPAPWSAASILLINLGLALLGVALILSGVNRQIVETQPRKQ